MTTATPTTVAVEVEIGVRARAELDLENNHGWRNQAGDYWMIVDRAETDWPCTGLGRAA